MIRLVPATALVLMFSLMPVHAAEILEYKGAVLVRQEDRGVMVFQVKEAEIKAPPSPNMKGYDLTGKEYLSNFAAAEKKEHAYQLLKVGNVMDIKINKVNAKTSYIAEVRLVKGEVLAFGTKNKVEKLDAKKNEPADSTKPEATKPTEDKPAVKKPDEKHSYSKAVIRKFDGKKVTFEVKGEEITADVSGTFKAIDRAGRTLKKDDRFRVFKEDNEALITTKKSGNKEVVTDVKLTRGALADK